MGSSFSKLQYMRSLSISRSLHYQHVTPTYNDLFNNLGFYFHSKESANFKYLCEDIDAYLPTGIFCAYFYIRNIKEFKTLISFINKLEKRGRNKIEKHEFRLDSFYPSICALCIKKPNFFPHLILQKERDLKNSTIFDRNVFRIIKSFLHG